MTHHKDVAVIGAPLDLGQERRGVDMGPSAIRYADLAQHLEEIGCHVTDTGDTRAELPELAREGDPQARYLPAILAACREIAVAVGRCVGEGRTPLVLGGDHSIAMGTLAGMHASSGPGGVIWIDAHADMNTPETSPSGNVHGMPLAAALGACGFDIEGVARAPWVDPARVVLVGARNLDQGEKKLVRELGICVLTMADVDRRGLAGVINEALVVADGPNFVHVSFDVDVCDPEIAPGVGTPVPGGLSYREAHLALELIHEAGMMTSLEVVEVNPILDHANTTGNLAVDLIASALGASIL
jgi:arginase